MAEGTTIITVDVEEWFHGHNYLEKVAPERWADQELRVVGNMTRCLDLLDRHRVQATCFVLGWTAERFPGIVREILDRGHEVACHSHAHPVVYRLTRDQFRADCERSLAVLARAGATEVVGYRAPSFSITPAVHDYLEVLQDLGFRYDCSLFPVHHPRYGQPASPRRPFRIGDRPDGLIEVPMPTWRCLGVNLPYSGGGYLRLLPWPAFRALRALAWGQGVPCIVYLHPWELDDFKPEVGLGAGLRLRSQGGQDGLPRKLEAILRGARCRTLGDYVAELRRGEALPIFPVRAA